MDLARRASGIFSAISFDRWQGLAWPPTQPRAATKVSYLGRTKILLYTVIFLPRML